MFVCSVCMAGRRVRTCVCDRPALMDTADGRSGPLGFSGVEDVCSGFRKRLVMSGDATTMLTWRL